MPTPTALLVIDMQRGLCAGDEAAHDIAAVLDRVNQLMARARRAAVPVILVQHEEPQGLLAHGSTGWQLAAGLQALAEDTRVRKSTPNAFHDTGLGVLLQRAGVQHLVVCGLQTDFCVDTTVRQALPLGYAVTLAADAHSTNDGVIPAAQIVAHHNRTLRYMTHFGPQVQVLPAAEVDFGG